MSEILGTLFKYLAQIMGVAAVLGIAYSVFGTSKTSRSISDMNELVTQIQSVYSANSNFSTLTTARVISGKLAPNGMINGSTLINPWGGSMTVAPNTNTTLFDVTTSTVPAEACGKLAASLAPMALKINSTAMTLPVDAGLAISACTSDTSNTLVFTFGR
jgi:hypothetical protein